VALVWRITDARYVAFGFQVPVHAAVRGRKTAGELLRSDTRFAHH
jgi:hypothetical protein